VLDLLFEQPVANINTLVKGSSLTPATIGKVMDHISQPDMALVKKLTELRRNPIFAYSAYIDTLNQDQS